MQVGKESGYHRNGPPRGQKTKKLLIMNSKVRPLRSTFEFVVPLKNRSMCTLLLQILPELGLFHKQKLP